MPKCLKCQSDFPNHIKINGVQKNCQNRKYCLECSPFGKHNTKQIHRYEKPHTHRTCPRCKTEKPINEFYKRRSKTGYCSYCKICTNQQTIERQRKLKQKAVDYKGGKCIDCGYDRCLAAMEFHHLDPNTKDPSMFGKLITFEKLKVELDKCVLLCCRCHRERHHL